MVSLACRFVSEVQPRGVISGLALGWDTAWAIAAIRCGVSFTAAVPFKGQELRWPDAAQRRYRELLVAAEDVAVVSKGGYSSAAMHIRNRWMVDRCDAVVALWDGSGGGTGSCIVYANSIGRQVFNLWPEFSR